MVEMWVFFNKSWLGVAYTRFRKRLSFHWWQWHMRHKFPISRISPGEDNQIMQAYQREEKFYHDISIRLLFLDNITRIISSKCTLYPYLGNNLPSSHTWLNFKFLMNVLSTKTRLFSETVFYNLELSMVQCHVLAVDKMIRCKLSPSLYGQITI